MLVLSSFFLPGGAIFWALGSLLSEGSWLFLLSLEDSLRIWLLFCIGGILKGEGEGDLSFADLDLVFNGVTVGLELGEK